MSVEEQQNSVRFRVSFPKSVYARLEKLGEQIGIEPPLLVRMMASIQLASWEMMYGNPQRMLPFVNQQLVAGSMESAVVDAFPEFEGKLED